MGKKKLSKGRLKFSIIPEQPKPETYGNQPHRVYSFCGIFFFIVGMGKTDSIR